MLTTNVSSRKVGVWKCTNLRFNVAGQKALYAYLGQEVLSVLIDIGSGYICGGIRICMGPDDELDAHGISADLSFGVQETGLSR